MAKLIYDDNGRLIFTEEMKKDYTILAPQMAPMHFDLIKDVFQTEGYKFEVLENSNYDLIHEGLKYVHNDTCIPALLVIGQMIDALKTGKYDLNKTALIITQTGGGCRASNYIHLLRKALKKAGMEQIPVISLNPGGLESNPGFKVNLKMIKKAFFAIFLGDLFMQLVNATKPYEINKGDTLKLYDKWNKKLKKLMRTKEASRWKNIYPHIQVLVKEFDNIPVDKSKKLPKVGIVGEIYVKYSPLGNNNLESMLESEGCEIVVPPIIDFFTFKLDYRQLEVDLYGGKFLKKFGVRRIIGYIEKKKRLIGKAMEGTKYHKPTPFEHLIELADGYAGRGNRMGEGWLLTAEMLELIESGAPNIVCTQPFGCLPNHISGKGMFKKIKQNHPEANIVPIDYDASASEINQINRIKLMISNAYRNLEN